MNYIYLILGAVFLPLLCACVVGATVRFISYRLAQLITCAGLLCSAVCSSVIFYDVVFRSQILHIQLLPWFTVDSFTAYWSVYIDALTAVMLIVVTYVSSAVHIYSIGYMSHDEHRQRFMCYLSLFTFCMLMLVCSDNFLQLFFGWEGVGVCSYLLIGFWFKKDSANAAAMKAFIVNRVGDLGFALGIFLIYLSFDSVEFASVFSDAKYFSSHTWFILCGYDFDTMTAICLLLFIGAMGKSAQLGLHTWLPDAMEGPTPVSALIHAATMVTAGVFMVSRCSPLFELSEAALSVVTVVGGVTCIFAAFIALTQTDIKRIIAYSTCSQLGYMFFACGVSAYAAGIFHLMTHAFFKALLFLGAGSVIHALSDEQDIHKMGGVYKLIPYTYAMMWIGSLALGGFFPFAGFFSKDLILEAAYASGTVHGYLAYYLGIVAALFTAFYSWRLLFLVFHGKQNFSQEVREHIHDSPPSMMIPLIFLSIGAIASGYVGVQFGMTSMDSDFWNGAIYVLGDHTALEDAHHVAGLAKWMPIVVGFAGVLFAYLCYILYKSLPASIGGAVKFLYMLSLNKFYIDQLYDCLFVRPSKAIGKFFWSVIDVCFIDGVPNALAAGVLDIATKVRRLQSGYIWHYAFVIICSMSLLLLFVFG